jgi:hypothetical protein
VVASSLRFSGSSLIPNWVRGMDPWQKAVHRLDISNTRNKSHTLGYTGQKLNFFHSYEYQELKSRVSKYHQFIHLFKKGKHRSQARSIHNPNHAGCNIPNTLMTQPNPNSPQKPYPKKYNSRSCICLDLFNDLNNVREEFILRREPANLFNDLFWCVILHDLC